MGCRELRWFAASQFRCLVRHEATGYYYVDFKQDVSGCAWTATLSNFNAIGVTGEITTYAYPFESGERVRVATRESGGAAANKPFVMSVFC